MKFLNNTRFVNSIVFSSITIVHTVHNTYISSLLCVDFKAERNNLPQFAYPRLEEFCAAQGVDFQVVDMRWGVPDEVVHDHQVSPLCIAEIKTCQQLSCGPNFVVSGGLYLYLKRLEWYMYLCIYVCVSIFSHLCESCETKTETSWGHSLKLVSIYHFLINSSFLTWDRG